MAGMLDQGGVTVAEIAAATSQKPAAVSMAVHRYGEAFGLPPSKPTGKRSGADYRVILPLSGALSVIFFRSIVERGIRPAVAEALCKAALPHIEKLTAEIEASGVGLRAWTVGRDDLIAWVYRIEGGTVASNGFVGPRAALKAHETEMVAELGSGSEVQKIWIDLVGTLRALARIEERRA